MIYQGNDGLFHKAAVPGGGSGSLLNGNLIYVDAVNGNNGTGTPGDASKPFLTLSAAKSAATVGYTIVVLPGEYTDFDLLKDSVNWHFMNGAKVVSPNNSGGVIVTGKQFPGHGIVTGKRFPSHDSLFPSHDMECFG